MTTPEIPAPPATDSSAPETRSAPTPAPAGGAGQLTELFMTHHAPAGAWASLTFGEAGQGVRIAHDGTVEHGDLVIGICSAGHSVVLPFVRSADICPGMEVAPTSAIERTLSPCIDEYALKSGPGGVKITLRIYTPHPALPNPKRSGNLQYATAPGILMDLLVDNSASDTPATVFLGLDLDKAGVKLRPVDWSSKTLVGVAESSRWLLAAQVGGGGGGPKEDVFTVLSSTCAACVQAGVGAIEPGGGQGGIAMKVAGRASRTLTAVWAVHHQGTATQGIEGRYLYNAYFPRIEAAANFILTNSQKIRESCISFDGRVRSALGDGRKLLLFSRALRAYEAQTQVVDASSQAYFAVIDEHTGYRNALDAAADYLPWELYRNPWVIRNLFDLATTSYSYHDKVRFPGDTESRDELREGGMTFAHDFGYQTAYTPGPASAEELRGGPPMATEQLLNALYMLTSYALLADDTPWAKTRLPFARELMTSLENRDHWDPERRTGILKAETDRGTPGRSEVTTFKAETALAAARGNLYLGVKTFCANMMLTTYFQNNNDLHSADYSYAFAQKTAAALVSAFDKERNLLPANLLGEGLDPHERMIAALEPLAIPTYLGLTSTLPEYFPELFNVLKSHAETCLREGCVGAGGGLKLASGGSAAMEAMGGKAAAVIYVLEKLFAVDISANHGTFWENLWSHFPKTGSRALATALYLKS